MVKSTNGVLVCGGAGYIGSHVVRNLRKHGLTIIVLDNFSTGHLEAIPDGVEVVNGSIGDYKLLKAVLNDNNIDVVVHLCANAYVGESMKNPIKYYNNNIANGLVLLQSMIKANVKKMIFSSSCTVYGNPDSLPVTEKCSILPVSPYGNTKAMFEQILADYSAAYNLGYCALRFFNAAGADEDGEIGEDHNPETHLIPSVLRSALYHECPEKIAKEMTELVVYGDDYTTIDGTCMRDYIHVTDIANAHWLAYNYLMSGGESLALNLANEIGFTIFEIIRKCEEVTGHSIAYKIAERRDGDADTLIGNAGKAFNVLGWRPSHSSVENIIATAWKWHKMHPGGYHPLKNSKL